MSEFDSKDFGERIKNYRIKRGLSQENIATSLGKSKAIVSRYEKGEVIPDAKDVSIICEELGIYEADLYENDTIRTMQHNKSKNPFGTDKLYVYFIVSFLSLKVKALFRMDEYSTAKLLS